MQERADRAEGEKTGLPRVDRQGRGLGRTKRVYEDERIDPIADDTGKICGIKRMPTHEEHAKRIAEYFMRCIDPIVQREFMGLPGQPGKITFVPDSPVSAALLFLVQKAWDVGGDDAPFSIVICESEIAPSGVSRELATHAGRYYWVEFRTLEGEPDGQKR